MVRAATIASVQFGGLDELSISGITGGKEKEIRCTKQFFFKNKAKCALSIGRNDVEKKKGKLVIQTIPDLFINCCLMYRHHRSLAVT